MDLVDERLHAVLTYVDVMDRAGVALDAVQLDAFGACPKPVPGRRRGLRLMSLDDALGPLTAGESTVEYLTRVCWISGGPDRIVLTALGRAVLAHANRPAVSGEDTGPLTVAIDPDDPLAYLHVFDVLSTAGSGLLVDPYLRYKELGDLSELAQVTRVLTSDRVDRDGKRLELLARALGVLQSPVEVRTAPETRLHDRFFISDTEAVYALGSSLNSITARPGVITPIQDPTATSAVREIYGQLWAEATPLSPQNGVSSGA